MIKVSVFYPKTADAKFDMGYYCEKHMPMVNERFGQRCKGMSVDEGLSGGAPGSDPTYVAARPFSLRLSRRLSGSVSTSCGRDHE